MMSRFKKVLSGLLVFALFVILVAGNTICVQAAETFKPAWPLHTDRIYYITALDYYRYSGSAHNGIDIAATIGEGEAVYPVANGKVYDHGWEGSMGNYVILEHTVGGVKYYSRYMHFQPGSIPGNIYNGNTVSTNTKLGGIGNTGNSDGAHLHFDIATAINGDYNALSALRGRTFEYYMNIPLALRNVRFYDWAGSAGARNSRYWNWIVQNSTIIDGEYALNFNANTQKSANTQQAVKNPTPSPTMGINMTSYPTTINQGSSFGLRGSVTSNYPITQVNGYILNAKGKTVMTTTDWPNACSMDVRYANLNNNLVFNKLPTGKYTLKIVASSGKTSATWKQDFTVKGSVNTNSNKSTGVSVTQKTTVEKTRPGVINIPSSWTSLTLRQGPSTKYATVTEMPQGARVTVYPDRMKNGWYYVNYNGYEGYASGKQIVLQ